MTSPPPPKTKTIYLLTGDIGGTNSRMGLYDATTNQPLQVKYYPNDQVMTTKTDGIFEQNVIAPFLKHCWTVNDNNTSLAVLDEVEIVACFAIAGPVRHNRVSMSNLHFIEIDGDKIANHTYSRGNEYLTKIKVCKIINDFVAQGYGCLTLQSSEVEELSPGSHSKIDPLGPKVCVGAGTGLGECYLTPDVNGAYTCFPSEGGHVEWAPRDDLEYKLWTYLKNKFEYQHRVSVERVVSGPGLVNCYEFLVQELKDRIDPTWHKAFNEAEESQQGKLVSDQAHALEGSLGEQALKIMCG
jgi:glucokinase